MRMNTFLTLLCATLGAGAQAQTLSYAGGTNPGPLSFNPTASASTYPFRSTPTSSSTPCNLTENSAPGTPEYLRCFKSFPQFFDALTPTGGLYTLNTTACPVRVLPYALTVSVARTQNAALSPAVFDAQSNTSLPPSRLEVSVNGGAWNAVTTYNPINGNPLPTPLAIFTGAACRAPGGVTTSVRFRLRLEGSESATGSNYTSSLTFRVQ